MPAAGLSEAVEANSVTEAGVLMVGHRCTLAAARGWITGGGVADIFVQLFDAALLADITVGTTVPRWVLLIPDGDNVTTGDGLPTEGLIFNNGVVAAATSEAGNNTAPAVDPHVRLGVN